MAIPYFKDIYRDLVTQSDNKAKGVNRITILQVTNFSALVLPTAWYYRRAPVRHHGPQVAGLHRPQRVRAWLLQDLLQQSGHQAKASFRHVRPNTNFRYDFDKDGYIIKEDVKLILSHIPINNVVQGSQRQEGTFTQEGGGSQVFLDRVQTQEEIFNLLEEVFG